MTRDLRIRLALTVVLAASVGLSYGYLMDLSGAWLAIPAGCLVGKVVYHLPLPRRLTEERAVTGASPRLGVTCSSPSPQSAVVSTLPLPARRLETAA